MVDKPAYFCKEPWSDLWDRLSEFVDFVESVGVPDADDCADLPLPTGHEIEEQGCLMMCRIIYALPVARCIIPLSPNSFLEVDCTP